MVGKGSFLQNKDQSNAMQGLQNKFSKSHLWILWKVSFWLLKSLYFQRFSSHFKETQNSEKALNGHAHSTFISTKQHNAREILQDSSFPPDLQLQFCKHQNFLSFDKSSSKHPPSFSTYLDCYKCCTWLFSSSTTNYLNIFRQQILICYLSWGKNLKFP